jgi:hypothetical protein
MYMNTLRDLKLLTQNRIHHFPLKICSWPCVSWPINSNKANPSDQVRKPPVILHPVHSCSLCVSHLACPKLLLTSHVLKFVPLSPSLWPWSGLGHLCLHIPCSLHTSPSLGLYASLPFPMHYLYYRQFQNVYIISQFEIILPLLLGSR